MELLLLLFLLLAAADSQEVIEITDRTINTQTSYLVKIALNSSTLNSSDKLAITFPQKGYTATQLASVTCSYACSVSNLTVSISNSLIPSNLDLISITLNKVVNPGSTLSSSSPSVTINISTNAGNLTKVVSLGIFTAGTLQSKR